MAYGSMATSESVLMPPGVPAAPECGSTAEPAAAAVGRRSIIFEADDLGLLYAFNEGVRRAWSGGVLTSTCLRANGFAYRHAIETVLPECAGLGVGVHLCLNEADPVAPPARVARLLGPARRLRPGFAWLLSAARDARGISQIETEFRAQIERVLSDGVRIDHLNSHQHVHMIPRIFRLTCRLAAEYGVPVVRIARELPHSHSGLRGRLQPYLNSNIVKRVLLNRFARRNERYATRNGLLTTDYFIGVSYTANMSLRTIRAGLSAVPYGSVELLLHPAVGPDARDAGCPIAYLHEYVAAPQRATELRSICSPALRDYLRRREWIVMNHAQWASEERAAMPAQTTPEIRSDVQSLCDALEVPGPIWVSEAQPDSRAFAQLALAISRPGQRVLDLGTGTGVVGIVMARMGRSVVAVDISPAAVRTAQRNASRHGVSMECLQSDLLERVSGPFDLIAFNPPYNFRPDTFAMNVAKNVLRRVPFIRRQSGLAMPRGVLKFHQQLIARLVGQAPRHLAPGGLLLIHAYESEVPALTKVLPRNARVTLLRHPALVNRTVGMQIELT
ncbi:MAG: Chitooligosaccharide deacetylase [Phycisphaerae bacterium]|nr:Chitooligosaccharide deacetylase [Phycisphaerae bacterium]